MGLSSEDDIGTVLLAVCAGPLVLLRGGLVRCAIVLV